MDGAKKALCSDPFYGLSESDYGHGKQSIFLQSLTVKSGVVETINILVQCTFSATTEMFQTIDSISCQYRHLTMTIMEHSFWYFFFEKN